MSGDPREPQDQSQTIPMLTITVLCLLFVFLAYLTHEHPTLMGPLTVATGGVTLVLAMLLYARRDRGLLRVGLPVTRWAAPS